MFLYIDRAVIREVKSRKKNDMVPHSWIKESLDLFGVAKNIKTLENIKEESNVVHNVFRFRRSSY